MDILFEGFRAIGSLFVNPIFYWVIILCFLPAFQRGELEKELFNQELSSTAAEVKNTFYLSLFMTVVRSEEHTSELQSRFDLVCRLLLEKKKTKRSECPS